MTWLIDQRPDRILGIDDRGQIGEEDIDRPMTIGIKHMDLYISY